jgi:hypothetical protein
MKLIYPTCKLLKITIALVSIALMACPAPNYRLKFRTGGRLSEVLVIEEKGKRLEIGGSHIPLAAGMDRVWIVETYTSSDSANHGPCKEYISLQSNAFKEHYTGENLKSGSTCSNSLVHEWDDYSPISYTDYFAFLDTAYIHLNIEGYFSKPYIVEIVFDKKWIFDHKKKFMSKEEREKLGNL